MMIRTQAAVAVLLFLTAGMASADTPDHIKEAERRFEEGKRLYGEGKYTEARTRFLEACAANPTEFCAKNLGMAEHKLGMWVDAATHFREYLDDPRTRSDPPRADIEGRFKEARAKCGEVVVTAPASAKVVVDKKDVGIAPLTQTVFVEVGEHEVTARWADGEKTARVAAHAGETVRVDLAPPTTNGAPPPTKTETYRPAAGWIVAGVVGGIGLVGVGLGIGFGVASSNAIGDAKRSASLGICVSPSAACNTFRDHANSASSSATASIVGYVTGGVLLGAAVVMAVVWPSKQRAVVVAPSADAHGGGLVLTGRF